MIAAFFHRILDHLFPVSTEPDLSWLDRKDRGMSDEDYYLWLVAQYKARRAVAS